MIKQKIVPLNIVNIRMQLFLEKFKFKLISNVIINFNIKLTIFQRKLTNYDKEILHKTFSLKMKSQINPNLMNLRKLNSPLIQFLKLTHNFGN